MIGNLNISGDRPSWDCQIGVAVNREASHEVQPPAVKSPAQCLAECDALSTCEFVQLMPAEDDATYCHQYSKTYQVFDSAGCSTGSPRCYYCYPGNVDTSCITFLITYYITL